MSIMYRPRLRSASGCDRCRQRRKKCDEHKPTCGACRRLKLSCLWRSKVQSSQLLQNTPYSSKEHYAPALLGSFGNAIPPFQSQLQLHLILNMPQIYQAYICPLAASDFHNLDMLIAISLQEPYSRHAMIAFSAYMFFTKNGDTSLEKVAISSYQTAIQYLKPMMSDKLTTENGIALVLTATFMGLLEGFGTGNAELGLSHFVFVARIAPLVFSKYKKDPQLLRLYRIVLENTVCNLACMTVCHHPGFATDRLINWMSYEDVFRSQQDRVETDYRLSPHLGGNHEFYRLRLEIICFHRQNHDQSTRKAMSISWLSQIELLEIRLTSYYDEATPSYARLYKSKYFLHALALRIYCLKIGNHTLQASNPDIVQIVEKARHILQSQNFEEALNPSLAWPLAVFSCASLRNLTNFQFFMKCIDSMGDNFGRGHWKHLNILKARLRSTLALSPSTFDPLDLLMSKIGFTDTA